jgi:hypothetical protein
VTRPQAGRRRDRGSISGRGKRFFLLQSVHTGVEPSLPSDKRETIALSPVVKWPGREGNHPSISKPKISNEWSYISTAPYTFIASTGTILLLRKHCSVYGQLRIATDRLCIKVKTIL